MVKIAAYDKEAYRLKVEEGLSRKQIARKLGLSERQVKSGLSRENLRNQEQAEITIELDGDNADLHTLIYKELDKGTSKENLCERFRLSINTVEALLSDLQSEGTLIDGDDYGHLKLRKFVVQEDENIHDAPWKGNRIVRFGLCGDKQFNSKYTQITHMNTLYDFYEKEGIKNVYDLGDIDEGEQMRQGHQYECYNQGADDHTNEIIKNHPRRKGMKTYFITGNHDHSLIKLAGYDIGTAIANKREDMIYLGQSYATVNLTPNCILELRHPGDGTAYAISYKVQKMVEAISGGEKPNILAIGHYHKMEQIFYRNIHCFQTGCFAGNTGIRMSDGSLKKIKDVKVGDLVITHKSKAKKVTEVFKRFYAGNLHTLYFGRKSHIGNSVSATSEHPILVERSGKKDWVPIKDVIEGDYVYVLGSKCKVCGSSIPYYMKLCKTCNPMDIAGVKEKLSKTKGGFNKKQRGNSSCEKHLTTDIIPFCEDMQNQGWKMVPVGGGVIPDAIGIKDNKIVAFELENRSGNVLKYKQNKYIDAPIMNFIDDVQWINCKPANIIQPRSEYEAAENDLIKVPVVGVTVRKAGGVNRKGITVYNFEVEDDNSYIASNVVVHNCLQAQTPWMRGRSIAAMLGGWIIEVEVDKEGTIVRIKSEFIPFYYGIKDDYLNYK